MMPVVLMACGSSAAHPSTSPTPTASGTTSTTATTAYTVQANPQPALAAGANVTAPDGVWTWIPVPEAFCGNGNTTGFAVNLNSSSNELLILYDGGGACYDTLTCYTLNTAANVASGYSANDFANDLPTLESNYLISNRQDPNNPLAQVNMAFIPYCTGDIHDGNQVVLYPKAPQATHHVGFRNGQVISQLLAATLPHTAHVYLAGFSAGGFGATFHYADTQQIFGDVRIDLINDSGSSFPGILAHPSWGGMAPSTCPTCDQNDFTTFIEAISHGNPNSRLGILSYSADTVLPLFFNITSAQFTADLNAYATTLDTLPNAKYFFENGAGHVLLDDENLAIGGTSLGTWIQQMVSDDPSWTSLKN